MLQLVAEKSNEAQDQSMLVEGREIKAAIMDLDGVITDTAALHAKAWERMFNGLLAEQSKTLGRSLPPFRIKEDYALYIDGKSRLDGIRAFINAREIDLPIGNPGDSPGYMSINGLGNLKNRYYLEMLDRERPTVFIETVNQIKSWRSEGMKVAVVSSSRNCRKVLEKTDLLNDFDAILDGNALQGLGLRGKPEPDLFLEAAKRLGVEPQFALIAEDALSGVEAGRRGNFGLVVGIDSRGLGDRLKEQGADLVLPDLSSILDAEFTPWSLIYKKWAPQKQGLRESLCALGNGYMMVRGAFTEAHADSIHYPGFYLAGAYDRAESEISGRIIEHEDLVNWPNWLPLTFKIGKGEWFSLNSVQIEDFRQEIDVRSGVLKRSVTFQDTEGRMSQLQERRFVHVIEPHLAAIDWSLTPLNWNGTVTIKSGIDGAVENDNVRRYHDLNRLHIDVNIKNLATEDTSVLVASSRQSDIRVAISARTRVYHNNEPVAARRKTVESKAQIWQEIELHCARYRTVNVEKIVAVFTSRDRAINEPLNEVRSAALSASRFNQMLSLHEKAWANLWRRCDIKISHSIYTQFVLRLHIFHLLQTVSPGALDVDAGVPARGWHGEAYRGHIFWDEIFVLPFFNLRLPELSREILMYRYRRLGRARRNASENGFLGAMYPWQSGSDGREESPSVHLNPNTKRWQPDLSSRQRHVGAAIAYNIWQHYEATHDIEFMSSYGTKMTFEIARYFASLTTYNSYKHRYEILHVVGPDEFHTGYPWRKGQGIDNNAYTNIMVSWTLSHALRMFDLLSDRGRLEIITELSITDEELHRWEDISKRLFVPLSKDGLIWEFEHFERLKELDWANYRIKYGNLQRLDRILDAEHDSTDNYQAVKQADVLMLFYLFSTEELREIFDRLGYSFAPEMIPKNIEYYSKRVSHGSTLSRGVHAWVLARLDRPGAWHLFKEALQSDISDIQGGTTAEGVHLGAMAGTVDIIQSCFTGLEMRDEILWFNPNLPDELPKVEFRVRYGGHWLNVEITHSLLRVQLEQSWVGPVKIHCGQETIEMRQGESHEFALAPRMKSMRGVRSHSLQKNPSFTLQ